MWGGGGRGGGRGCVHEIDRRLVWRGYSHEDDEF